MIKPADICWEGSGAPFSPLYGDVYFSRGNGLEESRYVFLQHNGLPQRWEQCAAFTIAETGFGTGLNFLATWQAFKRHAPAQAVLHYLSVEKHPLRWADLHRALALWPELADYAEELLRAYPAPIAGRHRLLLEGGRVRLTLLYGEAQSLLAEADFKADAWYLDGFAPTRNPEMWQEALFQHLPRLSAPGATLATFTASGGVKRALLAAGFRVEKVKGHGHKREMLRATRGEGQASAAAQVPSHALVIGAGAAGAATAFALALRGVHVTIIDRHAAPALATSANRAAILFPFASRQWMPHTSFFLAGLQFSRQQIRYLRSVGHAIAGDFCGMVQCPKPAQEAAKLLEIPALLELDEDIVQALHPDDASQQCGLNLPVGALYWPQSGWYSLADYTHACLAHPRIRLQMETEITQLQRRGSTWELYAGEERIAVAECVVIANASEASRLLPQHALPLASVRGQVTHLPASPLTQSLKSVLCFGGYLTPAFSGLHHLGATYEHHRSDTEVYADSHTTNLALARKTLAPYLPDTLSTQTLQGWAGRRTTSPDKLPLIGQTSLPQLYVSLAHGSRGALSCPLAGEVIAAMACGETIPLSPRVLQAVSPLRFI